MKTRIPALGFAVAAVVLGSHASLPAQEVQQAKKAKKECIKTSEINAITPLDDRHIFVKLSATRFHLFTVAEPCPELRNARRIAIADDARRVCDDGSTLITFEYPTVGTMRCRIETIDDVANKAAAWELIESRRPPE